jgi:GDP-L-fucose synthase
MTKPLCLTAAGAFEMTAQRVWVAGHRGMVGSAVATRLAALGREVMTVEKTKVDLMRFDDVADWLGDRKPDAIVVAAARVGGILANDTRPAEFLYENLAIAANVIHAAHIRGVDRLLFLGSSCIYPKLSPQPIREDSLLTGPLESTNEPYAIAKIAGVKLCQAYRKQYGRRYVSMMPCNLYGPNDNFDPVSSHVLAALISKFHAAKAEGRDEAIVWGSGTPLREFMFVDDLADAVAFCLDNYDEAPPINCGAGAEISVFRLAHLIAAIVGFRGGLVFDPTKPDGAPRKLMDSSRLASLGWRPRISLEAGVRTTYAWFLENRAAA